MKKTLSLLIALIMLCSLLAGCGATNQPSPTPTLSPSVSPSPSGSPTASGSPSPSGSPSANAGVPTGLKGSVTMSGSSALKPLADAAVEALKTGNPDLSITVNAGGSGTGLQNVSDKTVDIGNSDVYADEKLDAAKAKALVDHKVCVIGIAAVANPNVKATNLTKKQLIDIFTGKVKNWKEVGGDDLGIVIVNRPTSSGTRALFKKYALDGNEEAAGQALQEDNSGVLKTTVEQTSGAIAYLALSYTENTTLKKLSLDGIEPTYENIYAGKYPVWGYEHMYTNGEATGAVKSVIDFMMSDAFASNIEKMGYGVTSKMTVTR